MAISLLDQALALNKVAQTEEQDSKVQTLALLSIAETLEKISVILANATI